MHTIAGSQTAVGYIIDRALYIDTKWKTLKLSLPMHDKWFDRAMCRAN